MPLVTVKELLESGVHFGHRTSRWNPKMKPYILGKRNFIHIINLKETVRGIVTAHKAISALVAKGGVVLFVGTKRAAHTVILQEAQRCGMPFVVERWIGGTLTNFNTVRSRLKRLVEIETMEADGKMDLYVKKEQSVILREKRKLLRNLDGIRTMERLPDAMFLIDPRREKNALAEAKKLGLLTMALLDSDGDPTKVDIPIPGNDDAMRVIQIVTSKIADAVLAGRSQVVVLSPLPASALLPAQPAGEAQAADSGRRRPYGRRREEGGRRDRGGAAAGPRSSQRRESAPRGGGQFRRPQGHMAKPAAEQPPKEKKPSAAAPPAAAAPPKAGQPDVGKA